MQITFTPVRRDERLMLARQGDAFVVNGETFDFTPLPEGAELPADAIASDWFAGPARRECGALKLVLMLPHGPGAPDAVRFPEPLVEIGEGPVAVPGQEGSNVED